MNDQPLVEAYLADLSRALTGSDPRERAETLESVREHLAQAIPQGADPEQVRQALAELGAVEMIAAAASPAASAIPSAPSTGVDWLAVGALVAAVIGVLVLIPAMLVAPPIALPIALVALVMAVVHLRTRRTHPALAWTALIIAAIALLTGLLLALPLLLVSGGSAPTFDPVQSAPQG